MRPCAALTCTLLVASTLGPLGLVGCGRVDHRSNTRAVKASESSASSVSDPNSVSHDVAQVVFIDQEKGCDCTKSRIKTTWKALQSAVGAHHDVQVVRLHLDTQRDLVREYLREKPIMVTPGLYFMSPKGDLIAMLQGEVSEDKIVAVLQKK